MKRSAAAVLISLLAFSAPALISAEGEDKQPPVPDRAALIAAAREIMAAQTYCALITIDDTGRPQVRTMNPFPPTTTWWSGWPPTRAAARCSRSGRSRA